MTAARALAHRLEAWRSFRGIARAARTLAATHVITWASRTRQAARHLAWTQALAERVELEHVQEVSPVGLAIGTDLGLCGRLNTALAEELAASPLAAGGPLILVGMRLSDEVEQVSPGTEPQIILPAVSSLEAVESLSQQIATALELLAPAGQLGLSILLGAATTNDGQIRCELWADTWRSKTPDLPELGDARFALRAPILSLASDSDARACVAALRLRARIAHALCVAASTESSARLFTMSRAYEASDRSIRRQELDLRKLQQEAITQDMLEVRSGQRLRSSLV